MQHNQISLTANNNYIPGLDGVRAISIMIVLISHFGFGKIIPGGFGVTIFFFVSGFLITRILIAEQNKNNGAIDLKNFYIRRFLRLMPALYIFIAFAFVFSQFFGVKPTALQTTSAFLYMANYYDLAWQTFGWEQRIAPWGHLWSLAVEEHFYLLFPFTLALIGKTHKARVIFISLLIIGVAIWRYIAFKYLGFSAEYTYSATDCRIENIAWGCLLAVLFDGFEKSKQNLKIFSGWHFILIAFGAILFTLLFRDETFRATWRYSVQGAAIFIIILNLYMFKPIRFAIGILEISPMRFLGRLSYSLYLWHFPILWAIYNSLGRDIGAGMLSPKLLLIGFVGSFGLALMSYYFIEKPFFGLRKKFGGKPVEELYQKA